jgi:hypothetical protein
MQEMKSISLPALRCSDGCSVWFQNIKEWTGACNSRTDICSLLTRLQCTVKSTVLTVLEHTPSDALRTPEERITFQNSLLEVDKTSSQSISILDAVSCQNILMASLTFLVCSVDNRVIMFACWYCGCRVII